LSRPGPLQRRLRKRLKRLTKPYRRRGRTLLKRISRASERVAASVRGRIEQLRYRRGYQDLATIERAASKLAHLPRPDFIIIGAPKCGTSWLQRALAQHPSIIMVPDEIEYFSMHLDYPVKWYLSHFARQVRATPQRPGALHAIGEKSARYCAIEPDRIGLIHRLLPDAKLILMTRDPVARHWSQAKRVFSKRRVNKREGGVLGIPRQELFAYFDAMRPLGEFSAMIANWIEVYPAHQLLIVSQEQALARPREAYDAVLDHIGVARDYDSATITLLDAETNLGPKLKMPRDIAEYLEAMFAAERECLRDQLGDRTAVYVQAERLHV
jgi:Sulfotransferase family